MALGGEYQGIENVARILGYSETNMSQCAAKPWDFQK